MSEQFHSNMFRPSTAGRSRTTFNGGINVVVINIEESYNILEQQHPVPAPRHANFAFLISTLFNFLDLQYQGNNGIASPFLTRAKTMWVAVFSLLLYCFAWAAELEPRFTRLGCGATGLFGSILFVSLASLLFRSSASFVLFSLSVLFLNREMFCSVIEMFWSWIHRRVVSYLFRVIRSLNWRWFIAPVSVSANRGGLLPW